MIRRLAVPARSAMYVRYPAKCGHLLGQVSDLLGDQPCLLVVNQRLVIAFRALIDCANIAKYVGFIREIADVTIYHKRPLASGKPLLIAALVTVDAADIVIQDCLVLRAAYLAKNL